MNYIEKVMEQQYTTNDILRSIINRMYVTDNIEDLKEMYRIAKDKITVICKENVNRINESGKKEIPMKDKLQPPKCLSCKNFLYLDTDSIRCSLDHPCVDGPMGLSGYDPIPNLPK